MVAMRGERMESSNCFFRSFCDLFAMSSVETFEVHCTQNSQRKRLLFEAQRCRSVQHDCLSLASHANTVMMQSTLFLVLVPFFSIVLGCGGGSV